jgi:preprotein translocase subunit SecA
LEHPLLNRSIEQAQKRVEQHNFQIRKRTLEYDDVMNKQREVIYGFRNEIIHGSEVRHRLMEVMEEVIVSKVDEYTDAGEDMQEWNMRGLAEWVNMNFPLGIPEEEFIKAAKAGNELPAKGSLHDGLNAAQYEICKFVVTAARNAYDLKVKYESNPDAVIAIERYTILSAIDRLWQEHLYGMDSLRNSIGLRAYGQRDPLIEYKAEAYKMFEEMMVNIKTEICHNIFRSASSLMAFDQFLRNMPKKTEHASMTSLGGPVSATNAAANAHMPADMVDEAVEAVAKAKPIRVGPKVGRNEPCPCGSGKKFKNCCGKNG